MSPAAFHDYWTQTYPDCSPVGFRLRTACQSRWLRIHSLPASKRYAETESEYQEILRRQNVVLTDSLGDTQPFVLVSTGYSEAPAGAEVWPAVAALYPTSRHFLTIRINYNYVIDDSANWHWYFFMYEAVWTPGLFDTILRQVADDEAGNILFVSVLRHSVFAPYDGGADIILPSTSERDAMRHRYAGWLPASPSGL
jgi:hypothetical protein